MNKVQFEGYYANPTGVTLSIRNLTDEETNMAISFCKKNNIGYIEKENRLELLETNLLKELITHLGGEWVGEKLVWNRLYQKV